MLAELRLENYRCFEDHTLPFRDLTVAVGRNNAGKSTVIEGLRLISLVANRYRGLHPRDLPRWLQLPRRFRGVRPSVDGMGFDFATVFHRYGEPPACVTARFEGGASISAYVGPDGEVFGLVRDSRGQVLTTRAELDRLHLPFMDIMPPIGPVAKREKVLNPDYVRDTRSTYLAPIHFRNRLNLDPESRRRFRELAEATWPGLAIGQFEDRGGLPGTELYLWVREDDFTAEVGAMGHGLQMWLQIMWFLSAATDGNVVILDEPDVYMHADLQRRLIRILRERYKRRQLVIATHSVEIMSEVEPEQILVVDHREPRSRFADSLPGVQEAIDGMGGVHNIQLSRLWNARRCLIVEGDDIGLLRRFHNTLYPDNLESFDAIPNWPLNGWDGWNYAVGSRLFLKNAGGDSITIYCVLDSDYHTPEQIQARLADAAHRGVQLHIWSRKEIENYLLVPEAIQRVVSRFMCRDTLPPDAELVARELDSIVQAQRMEVIKALADELQRANRGWSASTAVCKAEEAIADPWQTPEGRLALVPGKTVLSALNQWSQSSYGVSFTRGRIAQELQRDELAPELVHVLKAIEEGTSL